MSSSFRLWLIVLFLFANVGVPTVWAQKNMRQKQDEKRENQRVSEAERDVRESQRSLGEVQREMRQALQKSNSLQQAVTAARNKLRDAREQAEDKLAESLGIEEALTELKSAKEELAKVSEPILGKLHATDKWKAAQSAADKATIERRTLSEDFELDDAARSARFKQLTAIMAKPQELDKAAVEAVPQGQDASQRVERAYEAVRKIRSQVSQDKVDAMPEVVRAADALKKAEAEMQQYTKTLSADRAQLAKAQQQVSNAQRKLSQARTADAKDRNK